MSMTSSTSDLPGDWTVVPPLLEDETENEIGGNNNEITSESQTDNDTKNVKKHVGSQVQDVVEEIGSFNHNDSCSSSDIDIIDENENAFDDESSVKDELLTSPPISNTDFSSDGPNSTDDTPNVDTDGTNENINERRNGNGYEFLDRVLNIMNHIFEWNGLFQERHVNGYFVVFFILMLVSANTLKNTMPIKSKDDSSELHGLVKELQLENKNLKSQLMLEIQNEKLFSALEEQMKGVKLENMKLQDLLLALQKESTNEKLESQKFYKKEINQLKEQVNILQFDNEELQKQLVRMRYGSYLSSNSDDEKDEEIEKQKDSENLSNEVKQLRKDLESEVSKLKKLNELIEVLTKELQKSSESSDSSFSEKQSSYEHKNKRSSDWSWKGVKKNIEDAVINIQKINISELFSHYIKNKKVYLEDAFKNIGEYFKTTMQKINSEKEWDIDIKSYLEECVNKWNKAKDWNIDVKSYLEECVNKWNKAKQEFFDRNENTEGKNEPEFSNSYSHKFHESEKINLKKHGHSEKHGKFSNEKENVIIDHSENLKKFMKDDFTLPSDEENVENDLETESWMFERAAERAKLRGSQEDMAINWYLKKVKDKYNNFKENFHDESHLKDAKTKKEKYHEF